MDDLEEQDEFLKQVYIRIAEANKRSPQYFPNRFYDRQKKQWRRVEILPPL